MAEGWVNLLCGSSTMHFVCPFVCPSVTYGLPTRKLKSTKNENQNWRESFTSSRGQRSRSPDCWYLIGFVFSGLHGHWL